MRRAFPHSNFFRWFQMLSTRYPFLCSALNVQVVRNSKQARTNDRRNHDSHNGSHVCSECPSGSKQVRVSGKSNHDDVISVQCSECLSSSKQARVNGKSNHDPLVCGCGCGRGGGVCVRAVWCGTLKTPRAHIQHVSVCTRTTRTCVSTCARGAGTHEDVLNRTHGPFSLSLPPFPRPNTHTDTHTDTHQTQTPKQHHTETDREREREGRKRKRKKTKKEREEIRRKRTREKTTRGGGRRKREKKKKKKTAFSRAPEVACTCRASLFCLFSHEKKQSRTLLIFS